MTRDTLLIGAALAAITAAGTAQAYEWGSGRCIGYDCARRIHDGPYYRPVPGYDDDVRPRRRAYEHRIDRSHRPVDDWDDDDED